MGRPSSFFGGPHCDSGGVTQFMQAYQCRLDKGQVDVAVHRGDRFNDGEVRFHWLGSYDEVLYRWKVVSREDGGGWGGGNIQSVVVLLLRPSGLCGWQLSPHSWSVAVSHSRFLALRRIFHWRIERDLYPRRWRRRVNQCASRDVPDSGVFAVEAVGLDIVAPVAWGARWDREVGPSPLVSINLFS